MNKFHDIKKHSEILSLIEKAPEWNKGEIWQTQTFKRFHYKIKSLKNDEQNSAIVFEIAKNFEFSPKFPVYVRINHRNLIFKLTARSFIISGNKLACIYPNMAKAIDKRNIERIPLPPDRDTLVVLKPLGIGAQELAVKLLDISRKGLGISVSEVNRNYLIRNLNFKLTSINNVQLADEHLMSLKYAERAGKNVIKSGLQLKRPLNDETYEEICKIIFGA